MPVGYDPRPMTRLVLRFLLLAVFFNTAIGLPAHEAKHLPHLGEAVAAWQVGGDDGSSPDEELHDLCEWCHAFGQSLAPTGAPAAALPAAAPPDRFAPPASDGRVRSARPWAYASRDPPRA
jgi:hypothetical protein